MTQATRALLSTMMFLQFFVWGSWWVSLGKYLGGLGFTPTDIGSIYGTSAIAAIVSPFLVGMVADRFFSTQKVLGVLHILGGGILWFAASRTLVAEPSADEFYWLCIGYYLCFMPTLALTNSLSFHHMDRPDQQFPGIRVLGTIGWIAAGVVIGLVLNAGKTVTPIQIAAGTGVGLGLFCFFLPHTPPASAGQKVTTRDVLGLDALELMKNGSFAVFMIASFLICIPLSFYYAFANVLLGDVGLAETEFKMTFGQMSEIFFMLVLPWFLLRLGIKWTLAVGMLCWVLRYVLFSFGAPDSVTWMLITGIVLHGICYDFFFVTGQIYVDRVAPRPIRGSAQGFLVLCTLGLGMFVGSNLSGAIVANYDVDQTGLDAPRYAVTSAQVKDEETGENQTAWNIGKKSWVVLPDGKSFGRAATDVDTTTESIRITRFVADAEKGGFKADEGADGTQGYPIAAIRERLTADWSTIWLWPAAMAGAVLLAFVLLFRDRKADRRDD